MKSKTKKLLIILIYLPFLIVNLVNNYAPNDNEEIIPVDEDEDTNYLQDLHFLDEIDISISDFQFIGKDGILAREFNFHTPRLYNISNPESITYVDEYPNLVISCNYFIISGNYLIYDDITYSVNDSIKVYDITDLNNPILYNSYSVSSLLIHDLKEKDGLIYGLFEEGLSKTSELRIFNVSNHIQDSWLGNYSTPSRDIVFDDISVYDEGYAIIAHNEGLLFINVSDSLSPKLLGEIEMNEVPISYSLYKNILYTSDLEGLHLFNLTDYSKSSRLIDYPGDFYRYEKMIIEDDLIYGYNSYYGDLDSGFYLLDIKDPLNITSAMKNLLVFPYLTLIDTTEIYFYGCYIDQKENLTIEGIQCFSLSDDPTFDEDGDGLNYVQEIWSLGTDITNNDTDNDGIPDGYEAKYYHYIKVNESDSDIVFKILYPNYSDSESDVDSDGLTNLQEYQYNTNPIKQDTDKDGVSDLVEIEKGSDPNDYYDIPQDIDPMTIALIVGFIAIIAVMVVSSLRKKKPLNLFLSHAVINFEPYRIKEMSETLEKHELVNKALYCEMDMKGNIDDWMDEMVPLTHVFVFLATQKSVFKSPDCGREIQLSNKYKLLQLPIRTKEVEWDDIGKIGLPSIGFDYPEGNPKELYNHISTYLTDKKEKMDKLLKLLSKNPFINLPSLESALEFDEGEAVKIGKILIKTKKIGGIITLDGDNFISESQVKKLIKNYQKRNKGIELTSELVMKEFNIDPVFEDEVNHWIGNHKKSK